jgi:hypothetical protein
MEDEGDDDYAKRLLEAKNEHPKKKKEKRRKKQQGHQSKVASSSVLGRLDQLHLPSVVGPGPLLSMYSTLLVLGISGALFK